MKNIFVFLIIFALSITLTSASFASKKDMESMQEESDYITIVSIDSATGNKTQRQVSNKENAGVIKTRPAYIAEGTVSVGAAEGVSLRHINT